MAIVTPTAIRQALASIVSGSDEITPELVAEWITNTLDAVAVGGGIAVGRGFGSNPATQSVGTTPVKISGPWLSAIESRGVNSDFTGGRLTILEGGAGHFDVDYNLSFQGTNGRGYISGVRVSRGGVESFETDTFDEESLVAAAQTGHLDGFGRVVNLAVGDWIELWVMASAANSNFILRQGQFRTMRIDSP